MRSGLQIEVKGAGVAARCCGRLLVNKGIDASFDIRDRPRVPAILLSPGTQQLLADVFDRGDLFRSLKQIHRRVVAWGPGETVTLPHSGVIVSEEELLGRLGQFKSSAFELPDWTIHTGGGLPTIKFGSRHATATRVRLSGVADPDACLMESGDDGWLFLLPISQESAFLLTAGAETEEMLAESRLVQASIDCLLDQAGSFPCYPRIADPLCGDRWLACGSAAIAFDPLCGDGTGHAIREAILACAVVESELAADELLWEYRLRLWRGFQRHLELCLRYYSTGGGSEWWQEQCASLRDGLHWMAELRAPYSLGRLHLNGFALERNAH